MLEVVQMKTHVVHPCYGFQQMDHYTEAPQQAPEGQSQLNQATPH